MEESVTNDDDQRCKTTFVSVYLNSIPGVPEHVPSPTPFIEIEEPSQLSSFDTESPYEESPPTEPAVREPITLPPNEGPSSRSYSFCDVGVCPSSSAAELSQDATASNNKKMLLFIHVIFY